MEHWKSEFWFDFFIMKLVSVLFWRVFTTIFLISYFKGGTGFVLSRGLDTSKIYFVIPDSPGEMASTTGYRDESDMNVQESDHGVIVDPIQVPSHDVRHSQQTLDNNYGVAIYPNGFSDDLMQENQREIGQYNPYEVNGGKIIYPNSQNENLEDKKQDKVMVSKKRHVEDLEEKEIIDEDSILKVIPLAKPSTNSNVERS